MRNKPRIRFKGFTEDWEQRKLGDIATFSKGNGYSKSDLGSSGDPIILYGRLYTNYETTISNVDTFVELKDKSIISQGGEVIVPASGETAEDISRASVVKNQGIIIGGDLNVIKANYLLDPTFLALTISNGEQQKELSKRAQGKSVVHLHNSDLQEVNLTFPLLNEQKEISTLFEKMDNIITLHQRKLEKLKLAKKALLQKLFPKNGSKFPELRFKGFADAWEQRKLGEFVKIVSGDAPSTFISGNCVYVKVDDLNYSDRIQLSSSNLVNANPKAHLVNQGATIFPKRGAAIMTNKVRIMGKDGYLDTNMMALIPEEIDKDFLFTFIQKTGLYKIADTSTIPQINNKHIEPYMIQVPSEKEQAYIGVVFKKIDKIITLHQRKLDKLQDVKKGLLQKMFV